MDFRAPPELERRIEEFIASTKYGTRSDAIRALVERALDAANRADAADAPAGVEGVTEDATLKEPVRPSMSCRHNNGGPHVMRPHRDAGQAARGARVCGPCEDAILRRRAEAMREASR
ncbi:MAG TPA: ribbon-helix-helix domain-containing protein [Candidatus Thermoplasmatota archaeon]|nr:ribbon-helix-helix domain-containing protein [Candidatus Thermoplasmatota archaeon]